MAVSTPRESLRRKERAENFPVALRALPKRFRVHLVAVYDVVRTIDDLGDEATGDRTAKLKDFRADLAALWAGERPRADVLRRLAPTVTACDLEREPFDRLVCANLQDQRVTRYPTYADLVQYCTLSADPVGRIVLAIFGATTARNIELSDQVCTALQIVEHCQDVAEDRRAGRIYLPTEDLTKYGVAEADLDRVTSTPAMLRLMAFEVERAAALLDEGAPLVGLLRGWARVAVAGYVAGGRAAIDSLRHADVLRGSPGVRKRDVARHLAVLLARGGAA